MNFAAFITKIKSSLTSFIPRCHSLTTNFGELRQREVRRRIVRRTSENSLDFGRRHHTGVVKVNLLGEAGKEALMSEENKALVRRSFEEVFNQGNLDAVE
jgi:steroid delta-isomerase-like uncharacterized protein